MTPTELAHYAKGAVKFAKAQLQPHTPEIEELQRKRLHVCMTSEHGAPCPSLEFRTDIMGRENRPHCGNKLIPGVMCGCPLVEKTATPDEYCPRGRW